MKIALLSAAAALTAAALSTPAQSQVHPAAAALFRTADVNNDGRISRIEFDAAREGLFARADADADGRLTVSELRALRPEGGARPQRRPSREQIQALRAIDADNDRTVSLAEFRAVGGRRFASADTNRDGVLTRDEMAAFARALGMGD